MLAQTAPGPLSVNFEHFAKDMDLLLQSLDVHHSMVVIIICMLLLKCAICSPQHLQI